MLKMTRLKPDYEWIKLNVIKTMTELRMYNSLASGC